MNQTKDNKYIQIQHTGQRRWKKMIKDKKMKSKVHHRAYRNKPLSDEENASNKEKSKVRVRVKHVFGFMKTTMKVDKLRTIGKEE